MNSMGIGRLSRDAFGQLRWSADAASGDGRAEDDRESGDEGEVVVPVRAFPLSAADEGISLVGPDGHERAWIERLTDLDEPQRGWVSAELAARDFAPVIQRIRGISGFTMPSVWDVETDRGDSRLELKGEEGIRRLSGGGLMITDSRGIGFRVPDPSRLDPQSRKWLDRFL